MKAPRLTSILLTIDVLLVAALAALWFAPGPPALWRHWKAPDARAPNFNDMVALQMTPNAGLANDYPAIVQRPLFSPERRPPASVAAPASAPASAASAPKPPDNLDKVKLHGLIQGTRVQGVLIEQDGKSSYVRKGEKVGDWTLQGVIGRQAIFTKESEQRALQLHDSLTDPSIPAFSASGAAPARPRAGLVPQQPVPVAPATAQLQPQDDQSSSSPEQPANAQPAPAPPSASFGGGRA